MDTANLILFFILAFIAETLGTIGGFGSSILFVPVAALFFDFHSALGITAIFHLSSNASKIYLFRKGVNKKLLLQFGIPSIVGVAAGAFLSAKIVSGLLELILGIFLVFLSVLLLIFRNLTMKEDSPVIPLGGGISGFTAGLLGTGGAIRGLALSAISLGKDSFIATSALIDMGIDLSRTVIYGLNGFIHKHDLFILPGLLIIGFTGTYTGKYLLKFVSENQFKKLVLILVSLVGIYLIFKHYI